MIERMGESFYKKLAGHVMLVLFGSCGMKGEKLMVRVIEPWRD